MLPDGLLLTYVNLSNTSTGSPHWQVDLEVKHQPKLTRLSPELARASILFFKYAGILTDDFFLLPANGLSGMAFSELLLLILIAPLSGLPFSSFASHSSLFSLQHRPKKTMFVFANIRMWASPALLHTLHTSWEGLARWDYTFLAQWHFHRSRAQETQIHKSLCYAPLRTYARMHVLYSLHKHVHTTASGLRPLPGGCSWYIRTYVRSGHETLHVTSLTTPSVQTAMLFTRIP